MDIKLEISQQQVLSQKMIQSAEILQMSSQELETYLKQTAVENPVIDIEEQYDKTDRNSDIERKLEWLARSDEQNRVYYSQEHDDDDQQDMGNVCDNKGEDLASYLLGQIIALPLSKSERRTAEYIIDMIDNCGYFRESLESVAYACSTSVDDARQMLKLIQGLDPAGVGAASLGECLLLQMDRRGENNPIAREIAANYLEMVGKNQIPYIARKLKVSVQEIMQAIEVIRSLKPKPGNSFSSRENLKYIVPDVTIIKLDGYFEILLNDYMYPQITINHYYLNMIKSGGDKETREYVGNKVRQAQWVIQCISQRSRTLLNVSHVIVNRQQQFFNLGPGHLRPLRLSDVAAELGIHESTVSRAVRDKYFQCSWGLFPMSYFFLGAVTSRSQTGSSVPATSEGIKTLLKEIIETENHDKPYSDRILADKLKERGIKISRRTVAKYRESMGIRDASGRKIYA